MPRGADKSALTATLFHRWPPPPQIDPDEPVYFLAVERPARHDCRAWGLFLPEGTSVRLCYRWLQTFRQEGTR